MRLRTSRLHEMTPGSRTSVIISEGRCVIGDRCPDSVKPQQSRRRSACLPTRRVRDATDAPGLRDQNYVGSAGLDSVDSSIAALVFFRKVPSLDDSEMPRDGDDDS